jgi:hypothetical protein
LLIKVLLTKICPTEKGEKNKENGSLRKDKVSKMDSHPFLTELPERARDLASKCRKFPFP